MLTVPVRSDRTQAVSIQEKRIDYRQPWVQKHLKSIKCAYQKAPWFDLYFPVVQEILKRSFSNIADLNLSLIRFLLSALGIERDIKRTSELELGDEQHFDKTGRVLNVCERLGVSYLYDGAAAASFLEVPRFEERGISVRFQNYRHPIYHQQFGGFLPYMSTLDLLMNCGRQSLAIILSGGVE